MFAAEPSVAKDTQYRKAIKCMNFFFFENFPEKSQHDKEVETNFIENVVITMIAKKWGKAVPFFPPHLYSHGIENKNDLHFHTFSVAGYYYRYR